MCRGRIGRLDDLPGYAALAAGEKRKQDRLGRRPCGELAARGSHGSSGWLWGAKVDLTVSGLKSDSPSRVGIAGSAPAVVRAQERAVCRKAGQRPQQPEHSTFCRPAEGQRFESPPKMPAHRSPSQGRSHGWDGRHCPMIVRRRRRTNRLRRTKKTCKCRPFREAAEGIRTLDLLHGKQNMQGRLLRNMPAKGRVLVP